MRRAALLHCADCSENRFKSLRHQNLLPFDESASRGAWKEFSLWDAFALRLQLDLMGADDTAEEKYRAAQFPPSSASALVDNLLSDIRFRFEAPWPETGYDVWLGAVGFAYEEGISGASLLRIGRFVGSISSLHVWLEAEAKRAQPSHEEPAVVSIVNGSRVLRLVEARADELGLTDEQRFPEREGRE